jgi:hypothetical protein
MLRSRLFLAVLLAPLLLPPLLLGGCSDDQSRAFGFTRQGPDEFTVTTRAPLSMPPEIALPTPRPGAPRPQEQSQTAQAEATLAPDTAMGGAAAGGATPGQSALVAAAGAGASPGAQADTRRRVDAEAPVAPAERSFVDRLMFWQSPDPAPGAVVDPQKEAERLRANAALGRSPEAGTTPIAQPESRGFFDRLF